MAKNNHSKINDFEKLEELEELKKCDICMQQAKIKKTYCGCSTKYCETCYNKTIMISGIKCTVCTNMMVKISDNSDEFDYHEPNTNPHTHGFSLNPESYQPSGNVNMNSLVAFAISYNFLRTIDGQSVLRYSS